MKWILTIFLFVLMIGFISAVDYTPPLYNNVTIVLDSSYTIPPYTNVTIVLGEEFYENASIDYNVNLPLGFIRYLNCSPDYENPQSTPEGQTNLVWALNAINDGNVTEDMQIRINQTAATGWEIFSSNTGDLASPTLLNTTYQTILSSVDIGETKHIWLYANCSFINSNSRTYIEMRGV
jgi:hypothetical protein